MADASRGLRERLADHPVMLAPMAGVTDAAYREMAVLYGCPLCYSEMVSVAGLAYASQKTWELVEPAPLETQIAVQLFGSRPEQFEGGAAAVREHLGDRLALIDINMACPVAKVFKKGEGAALMRTPELAQDCVRAALRGAGDGLPVTCKIRAGIDKGEVLAPEFARQLEEAGASAIAVHGRAARQFYAGSADWSVIGEVVSAVSVPVIGSGDVFEPADVLAMQKQTGCAGVFVARGSYGNPWIFERTEALRTTGVLPDGPTVAERFAALREHIGRAAAFGGNMARLRPVTCWYIKGLPGAASWRDRAMKCRSADDFLSLTDEMEEACREHGLLG